ncbi:MAG: co-chaperone GroES [Candidatus Saccharibacteria bacterium]
MNIQPLGDRVVLQQLAAEETTKSGIILPDSAKEKPAEGKVVAVGKDVAEVQKDDTVLYGQYGPTEVKVDGEEYMVVKEEDILAVIKGDK